MFMMMKKRGKLENRKEDGKDKRRIIWSFNIEWKEMEPWKRRKEIFCLKMMHFLSRLCSFSCVVRGQYFYFNPHLYQSHSNSSTAISRGNICLTYFLRLHISTMKKRYFNKWKSQSPGLIESNTPRSYPSPRRLTFSIADNITIAITITESSTFRFITKRFRPV